MGLGRYMDGCGTCMKYSLFIVNFITFLGGLALAGLGIWLVVDKKSASTLLGTNLYIGFIYVLIATGILVAIISCFGCFGAIQEVKCMLVTYFIILFLIFVTMLVGGILGYVYRSDVETSIKKGLQSNIHLYNTNQDAREQWDHLQIDLKCCGIDDFRDWKGTIPDSCCIPARENVAPRCVGPSPAIWQQGCYILFSDKIKHNAAIIGGAGIGVACIMLFGMIFACALINMIE